MARRGDFSKPKMNASQRYQARVQRNRIIGQLERLDDVYSPEDIRNAGNNAWKELGGADLVKDPLTGKWGGGTYTVKDTDTLSTIAQTNGTTEADLLKSNPDMNQLKTGMVLNTYRLGEKGLDQAAMYAPQNPFITPTNPTGVSPSQMRTQQANIPGSEAWRIQNANKPGLSAVAPARADHAAGGQAGGLPSNAAQGASMGALSTFREGEKQYTPGVSSFGNNYVQRYGNAPSTRPNTNPALSGFGALSAPSIYQPAVNAGSIAAPRPTSTQMALLSPNGQRLIAATPAGLSASMLDYRQGQGYRTQKTYADIRSKIDLGYTPTVTELNWLVQFGKIKKTPALVSGGGGGFTSRGGGKGGRGGGGGKAPKTPSGGQDYANSQRQPAFGNGTGAMGLINWRI